MIIIYIREDLEEEIKKIFGIRKMSYIGTSKNIFDDNLLLFDIGKNEEKLAFEMNSYNDAFVVYKSKTNSKYRGSYYTAGDYYYLSFSKGKTILKTDGITVKEFEGEAFNFDKELVILKLENSL